MPSITRVTGKFPAFPDHVHAYIIEFDRSLVIVDGMFALQNAKGLRKHAETTGKKIEAVVITHGHPDHWLGLAAFPDVPKLATQACIDFMHREDDAKHEVAKAMLGDDFPEPRVYPDVVIKDGHTLNIEGHSLRFIDLGPGESDADGCWVIDIDGQTNAFVGDSIMNRTHGFFGDGHVYEWLKLLDRLELELPDAKFHIGHGVTPADKASIEWMKGYIKHFMKTLKAIGPNVPNDEKLQARLVTWQQEYLPGNEFLFLTTFELERGVNRIRAAMAAQPAGATA
jgi:glyoxylase-like metal-dependent hydrolase (beta-lactamase superfamily II)